MNKSNVGFTAPVINQSKESSNYREVLFTGKHMQIVLMTLQPGEEIGLETHAGHDQFFHIVSGAARVVMNNEESIINANEVAIVPDGVAHNVINAGNEPLKLYTIYAPAEHPVGTVQAAKPE